MNAFLANDYAEALRRFRLAAQADEKNGEAWMAVAHSAFALGAYDESAVAIAQAANLGAFPRGYRYDPKSMYPQENRFEELFQRLQDYRQKHPEDANGHLVAAYFWVAQGKQAPANSAILDVLRVRPDDPTAPLLNLAMLPPLPPEKTPDVAPGQPAPAAPAPAPLPSPAVR